jgi:hypothetical protein
MTENPGSIPMGRGLAGGRLASRHAIQTAKGVRCPLHEDGIVTRAGTTYRCDEGHTLLPPSATHPPQ